MPWIYIELLVTSAGTLFVLATADTEHDARRIASDKLAELNLTGTRHTLAVPCLPPLLKESNNEE
jgi:hypothetical protein